jgi:hypothetical protein
MTSVSNKPRERSRVIQSLLRDIAIHVTNTARKESVIRIYNIEQYTGEYDRRKDITT